MPAVFHQSTPPTPAPASEPRKIVLLSDSSQVATATDDTLRRALVTCDGCGQKMKVLALEELLRRSEEIGYQRGAQNIS